MSAKSFKGASGWFSSRVPVDVPHGGADARRGATVPGVRGVMLTFEDFASGMEQFGRRIQSLRRSRDWAPAA